MSVKSGVLVVKVKNAILTRDTEFWGKMSPFVEITIGSETRKTGTQHQAGKHPNFGNEVFQFNLAPQAEMIVKVFDEETIKKHDLVGEATYDLDEVSAGRKTSDTVLITFKGKSAGHVILDFEFTS
jgi:Ca2+-dependent lipid-binding protein